MGKDLFCRQSVIKCFSKKQGKSSKIGQDQKALISAFA